MQGKRRVLREGAGSSCAFAFLALGASVLSGCISITTVTIPQKTSLERQLIGDFEPLSEEEALAASVRAAAGGGRSVDDLRQRAVAARRRQLFNRDDIDELKDAGCLGEGSGARLVRRECEKTDATTQARIAALVEQENVDRGHIVEWAIAADPVLTPADREQVVQVYARAIRERAAPGHWFQEADGSWTQIPGGS